MRYLAVFLITLLIPSMADGTDTWSDPFPGVRHLARTTSGPNWRIHAVVVDLCAEGVTLRATRSGEKARVTSSFGQLVGAEVAVNGDFYASGYNPIGLAIGDDERWSDDPSTHGWIGFGPGNVQISPPVVGPQAAGWVQDAVGGNIMVVSGGNVTNDSGTFCTTRHPRTAAGLSDDKQTLILAVVDGRRTASVGMTCMELGNLMKEFGSHDAINLDGGGSTTMWMSGEGVLNNPSDGGQRTVANHLAVLAKGTGEPEACNRYEAEIAAEYFGLDDFYTGGSSEGVPDVLVGDEFQGSLSLTSRTPRRWRGTRLDYWIESPYLSATNYRIESDHPVYDQMTWVVNSADSAPENPAKSMMGQSGSLTMHAYTTDETKRVLIDLRADRYSVGAADHPDIRTWIHHIDGIYGEQGDYFEDPTNGNAFGRNMRAFAQLDVLSPSQWQFEDDGAEGWTLCGEATAPPVAAGAMTAMGCVESPVWSEISHQHLAIRFVGRDTREITIAVGDSLLDFQIEGDAALLDLGDAHVSGVDRFGIRSQVAVSIEGIWFQGADGESSSSGAPALDLTPLQPVGVDANLDPIDEQPDDDSAGAGGGAGDSGDSEEEPDAGLATDRVIAEGGCCATSGAPRSPLALVLIALFGLVRRRSKKAI